MYAQPPPLSAWARQPIPPRLEALVMRCLAEDPADRPESADQLEADLPGTIDGQPWTAAEARAWWAGHLDNVAQAGTLGQ
jgi:hypothetical protein